MREISMERVNKTRENILDIIKSPVLTHEQKVASLANQADSLMEVLDLPEGLDELLNVSIETKCICDLSEGHAPLRPRYIVPDYAKFMKEGSKFLQLDPPKDLYEALNSLLIFYKHVPSVTNFPVYVGQLDQLLEPFIDDVPEDQAKKLLKMFMTHIDRTVLDSFSHGNIGPTATKAGRLLLEVEEELENAVAALNDGEIVVMQNTRYEKGESKNDPELAAYWAKLGDLFVEDAFGSVHRAHASTAGIASILPNALGFLVEKEVKMLGAAVDTPERPFVAIIGGAKVSDKIAVVDNLLKKADKVLIGGGMAYTFLKAMGCNVGKSLVEEDKVELAKEYIEKAEGKLILPVDHVCADKFAEDANTVIADNDSIPADYMGLDIGPKSIELYKEALAGAKTVVWNGPMGVFEMAPFAKGTLEVCTAISELPGATTVIGGGDSAAAAIQLGFAEKFSHISTGGGASLEYMEGKVLPGIAVIADK